MTAKRPQSPLERLADLQQVIALLQRDREWLAANGKPHESLDAFIARRRKKADQLMKSLGLVRATDAPMPRRALPWWPFPARYDADGRPVYEVQWL